MLPPRGTLARMTERRPVFFRPPDQWEELSETEQLAWARGVVERIAQAADSPRAVAEPATDPEGQEPAS